MRSTSPFTSLQIYVLLCIAPVAVFAQEQVDQLDKARRAAESLASMTLRVRVTQCDPSAKDVNIHWRRGGEGLGGSVTRGTFPPVRTTTSKDPIKADLQAAANLGGPIAVGQWSEWVTLETVVGKSRRWEFPSVTVSYPAVGRKQADSPASITVEFEVAEGGALIKRFTEASPRGATAGFAFPGALLDERGGAKNPAFLAALEGLSGHARDRYEHLKQAAGDAPLPTLKHFALLGHVGGYGQAPERASGYGVRHCNPAILADEFHTLQLMGINGLVGGDSFNLAEATGMKKSFERMYWGGPGAGSPMAAVSSRGASEPDGCPFDPRLKEIMAEQIARVLESYRAVGAKENWGLWWDEIGVAVKSHMTDCPRCRDAFVSYLKAQKVTPEQVGATSYDYVKPYPIWSIEKASGKTKQVGSAPPTDAAGKLRYYYTFRFMSYATGQLFPGAARAMKEADVRLYAMQGPTPSWAGHSLDWHEFYDTGANTAVVWETSNRDPRAWQWESYLADIARGIALRHDLPIGCLVKPHRGAPQQRMLTGVTRGVRVIEWYTYGPDYSKGDSFSQSPRLLEEVAEAGRFLSKAEDQLYDAKWAQPAEVAFVSPRSSEIWGKAGLLGITPFENAKWVYLALRHAQVPLDILSEQQLAEGALTRYKVLYVPGPNLRGDAAAQIAAWVASGGVLWTDCAGLSCDEANEPLTALHDLLGMSTRDVTTWGKTPAYGATTLQPLADTDAPASAVLSWKQSGAWGEGTVTAAVGREAIKPTGDPAHTKVIAQFADGKPAVIEHTVGKGRVFVVGAWAGLTYSAKVRQAEYDMSRDFDPAARALIAAAAVDAGARRPAIASSPMVETVMLDKAGKRSVALMNWCYARSSGEDAEHGAVLVPQENVVIDLPGVKRLRGATSQVLGKLAVEMTTDGARIHLPRLVTIDLVTLDE